MVSIIIPYYNVEQYICRCVESVISQTCTQIEVILVDDGSTDQSALIIDSIIDNYCGPIAFHHFHQQKNSGVSAARNRGIFESSGDYLFFLDGDDYLSEDCIELMVKEVLNDRSVEMVMGDLSQVNGSYNWPSFYIPNISSKKIISYACSYQIYTMPWNKLISRDFIHKHNLFFEEGLCHEDDLWSFKVACKLQNLISIPQKTYFYVIHENSIQTNKSFEFHYRNHAIVKLRMIEFVFLNNLFADTEIFHFITDDIFRFVFDGINNKRTDLSRWFLENLRRSLYWDISFIRENESSFKNYLFSFYRYLPQMVSIPYFMVINKVLNINDKFIHKHHK